MSKINPFFIASILIKCSRNPKYFYVLNRESCCEAIFNKRMTFYFNNSEKKPIGYVSFNDLNYKNPKIITSSIYTKNISCDENKCREKMLKNTIIYLKENNHKKIDFETNKNKDLLKKIGFQEINKDTFTLFLK